MTPKDAWFLGVNFVVALTTLSGLSALWVGLNPWLFAMVGFLGWGLALTGYFWLALRGCDRDDPPEYPYP